MKDDKGEGMIIHTLIQIITLFAIKFISETVPSPVPQQPHTLKLLKQKRIKITMSMSGKDFEREGTINLKHLNHSTQDLTYSM